MMKILMSTMLAIALIGCGEDPPSEEIQRGDPAAAPSGYSEMCDREPEYRLCP